MASHNHSSPMRTSSNSYLPNNNLAKSLQADGQNPHIIVQYQKNNLIGKGTFGRVYTALDLRTGGLLAVKSVKLSRKTDEAKRQQQLAEIENEVNLLKLLDHPNIVKYHCLQRVTENEIDLVLEMVSGGSIRQILDRFGQFDE